MPTLCPFELRPKLALLIVPTRKGEPLRYEMRPLNGAVTDLARTSDSPTLPTP